MMMMTLALVRFPREALIVYSDANDDAEDDVSPLSPPTEVSSRGEYW